MKYTKLSVFLLLILFSFSACASKNNYDSLQVDTINSIKKVENKNKETLGIAFGGGGVRGFYHLGVIKALEESGIKADIVTGTSAGSIAASLYASGMSYEEIAKIVLSL